MASKTVEQQRSVVDDYNAADEPKYEAIRAELREVIDTLYGARLSSARDYLMYVLDIENKLEDELAANSPGFQERMRQAEQDIAAGRTTPWREVRKDVFDDDNDVHG